MGYKPDDDAAPDNGDDGLEDLRKQVMEDPVAREAYEAAKARTANEGG